MTPTRSRSSRLIPPQLATRVSAVPSGADWIHESKLDGYRIQCHVARGQCVLLTRNGLDWTDRFPAIRRDAITLAGARDIILDGEVVIRGTATHSAFQSLQRAVTERATDRAVYWAFDLLSYDGLDLRPLPLADRRAALRNVLVHGAAQSHLKMTLERRGSLAQLVAAARTRGDEGIISKRRNAPYRSGRTLDWVKIKHGMQDEFVVIGYTAPQGSRAHFGALLVATRAAGDDALRYAGRVGSGFDATTLRALLARLRPRASAPAHLATQAALPHGVQWVKPALVISAKFAEWTADGLLRQATFVGVREDKAMHEVSREAIRASAPTAGALVGISHVERVVYAEGAVTKGDVATYYEAVAPLMLPHIAGRPLSLLRCPSGAARHCFFQKHWTDATGDGMTTRSVAESDGSTDAYAVAMSAGDLHALVQANVLEMHVWGSKFPSIDKPDRIIFDLDPDPRVPWLAVCDAARRVRDVLFGAGLQSWVKLSGGKGLHVTVPVSGPTTWEQAAMFSKLIATQIAADAPDAFTTTMAKRARTGRIFIDWMRNARGATAIAPWSLRARTGAPVAMPLLWPELDDVPRGDLMTIRDVIPYLSSLPPDPWKDLLSCKQRVTTSMVRTLGRIEG